MGEDQVGEDQDDEKTHGLHRLQNPDVPRTTLAALMGPGNTAPKPTDLERLKKAWSTASPEDARHRRRRLPQRDRRRLAPAPRIARQPHRPAHLGRHRRPRLPARPQGPRDPGAPGGSDPGRRADVRRPRVASRETDGPSRANNDPSSSAEPLDILPKCARSGRASRAARPPPAPAAAAGEPSRPQV